MDCHHYTIKKQILQSLNCRIAVLHHLHDPQNHAVDGAGEDTVQDDGAGDGEDLRADTEDEPLGFGINGGGDDRVCKAGDRDERARARVLCDVVKHADACEQSREENQRDRHERVAVVLVVACDVLIQIKEQLPEHADAAAEHKGETAVFKDGRLRCRLFYILLVFFLVNVHKNPPFENSMAGK